MSESFRMCCPAPVPTTVDKGSGSGSYAIMSNKFWPFNGQKFVSLHYAFLENVPNKAKAVIEAMKIWTRYANVRFYEESPSAAEIRITFALPNQSWSEVGVEAKLKTNGEPTMCLGWIADADPPSAADMGTILHELGHALGMLHEHQSPARGGRIRIKEQEAYIYYGPLLQNSPALVKSQVIDPCNLATVANFSEMDLESIMMYPMHAYINEPGIEVPPNLVLSDLDKAFIMLNYPCKEGKDMALAQALNIAGVGQEASSLISELVGAEKYDEARETFSQYNASVMQMYTVNQTFLKNSGPAARRPQFGIQAPDTLTTILQHPVFKSAVKHIVNQILVQRGIHTVVFIPGADDKSVLEMIKALMTRPEFGRMIHDDAKTFTGVETAIFPGVRQSGANKNTTEMAGPCE